MARKLNSYQTSLGFFDLAIAAPSMKAALEAWGADSNLFHQGAAKESDDPDVIAATMAKPARRIGRIFGEHAELPTDLGRAGKAKKATRKSSGQQAKKPSFRPVDKAAERKAALEYERERKRREREQARKEATRQKQGAHRQQAVDKAQAALDKAEREHTIGPRPSKPRWRLSGRNRKPRTPSGTGRRSDCGQRCSARGARLLTAGSDRTHPSQVLPQTLEEWMAHLPAADLARYSISASSFGSTQAPLRVIRLV
jgi:hypothetical protein